MKNKEYKFGIRMLIRVFPMFVLDLAELDELD